MTFYGKDPEPETTPTMKRFYYTAGPNHDAVSVRAQHVYFYESGHVGFWNDTPNDGRELVLATKAHDIWEEDEE